MADLVRECVAEYLARWHTPGGRELARRARGLKGRFRSGSPDLAEAHDRHLDDAFDAEGPGGRSLQSERCG